MSKSHKLSVLSICDRRSYWCDIIISAVLTHSGNQKIGERKQQAKICQRRHIAKPAYSQQTWYIEPMLGESVVYVWLGYNASIIEF